MSADDRHNYEYTIDIDAQNAAAKVVRMVGSNKRVLEIGAGPGSITKMIQKNNCSVVGVELDPSAITKLSAFCEKVYQCDLNASGWVSQLAGEAPYDVLVAADVFEHLYWPNNCLLDIKPFIAENGYLVVSLPHVGNNAIIASIMDGDFEYRDWGLLDRTHIRFFGLKNMQDLFVNAGYKIVAAEFVVEPPEKTELASHWLKLSWFVKAALGANKFGSVYQVVIKAVPVEFEGEGISLMDLPVPHVAQFPNCAIVKRVGAYVRPSIRKRIKRMLLG